MKVLHVSYGDGAGGAAIAACRLHKALLQAGVDSEMLCVKCCSGYSSVIPVGRGPSKLLNQLKNMISNALMCKLHVPQPSSLNLFPSGLASRINNMDCDVVNLHWVNAEMLSIREITKIKKPVVWTMHDMWAFCGAEHYTADNRYVTGYQKTDDRRQRSEPGLSAIALASAGGQRTDNRQRITDNCRPKVDINRWVFRRKQKAWKNFRPTVVCVGTWLGECVRKSVLFGDCDVRVIPNTLNMRVFKPIDRKEARNILNLPQGKKLVMFGAIGGASDLRKGFDLLQESLSLLSRNANHDVELVVFGQQRPSVPPALPFPVHYLGHIYDEPLAATAYSAVDVMCVPSRQETFGQTAAEALACGTPVVAFNTTGLKDIVLHLENGYLADAFDVEMFADGICWALNSSLSNFRENLAESTAKKFSLVPIATQYKSVYDKMIGIANVE